MTYMKAKRNRAKAEIEAEKKESAQQSEDVATSWCQQGNICITVRIRCEWYTCYFVTINYTTKWHGFTVLLTAPVKHPSLKTKGNFSD